MKIDSYVVNQSATSEYYSLSSKIAIMQSGNSFSLSHSTSQTAIRTSALSYEEYGQFEGTYFSDPKNPALLDDKTSGKGKALGRDKASYKEAEVTAAHAALPGV